MSSNYRGEMTVDTKTEPETTKHEVSINRVALESCAAIAVLKELSAKDPDTAQAFLHHLWETVSDCIEKHVDLTTLPKDEDGKEGAGVAIAAAVLGGYFVHRGDWKGIAKAMQEVFEESHPKVPPAVLGMIVHTASEQMLKILKDGAEKHQARKSRPAIGVVPREPVTA